MRVLFDVAELAPGMGKSMGIYNYAKCLLVHLPEHLPPGWELHVACNAGGRHDFAARSANVHQHVVLKQLQPGVLARQAWMRWGAQALARRTGAQVYFTPKGFLPGWWGRPMGLKSVAVLHDLIPLWYAQHHPEQFSGLEKLLVNGGLLRTARSADQLLVISQATADDVARVAHRQPGSMQVVYNGVPVVQARAESPRRGPYVFAMASALPHKNLQGLLATYQCYRQMADHPWPWVICGVDDPGVPGVEVVRGLDDQTLHTYYAHAEAFVFLSFIEGFGFPPLEALSHGTPVVCSDVPALREVTRGRAVLVPPDAPMAAARGLLDVLSGRGVAPRSGAGAMPQQDAIYSWDRCAAGVMAGLIRAAEAA